MNTLEPVLLKELNEADYEHVVLPFADNAKIGKLEDVFIMIPYVEETEETDVTVPVG